MFIFILGTLLTLGIFVSTYGWSADLQFMQPALQLLFFGLFGILFLGWLAIRSSKVWEKGSKIYDEWDELYRKVGAIYEKLFGDEDNPIQEAESPLKLTDRGKALAKSINADRILSRYGDQFDASDMTNAYDIQQTAKQWADDRLPDLMEEGDLNRIKNVAFENGLQLSIILRTVIGLLLRDRILEQKGIPLAQVDEDEEG
jgi:hypothetical protein